MSLLANNKMSTIAVRSKVSGTHHTKTFKGGMFVSTSFSIRMYRFMGSPVAFSAGGNRCHQLVPGGSVPPNNDETKSGGKAIALIPAGLLRFADADMHDAEDDEFGGLDSLSHKSTGLASRVTMTFNTHSRRYLMLVLSRKKHESIIINDDITVTVVEIRGDKVRLGIVAPKQIPVHRQEVHEAIHGTKEADEHSASIAA